MSDKAYARFMDVSTAVFVAGNIVFLVGVAARIIMS